MEMKGDSTTLDVDFGTGTFQLFGYMQDNQNEDYALGVSEAYVKLARTGRITAKKTRNNGFCGERRILPTLVAQETDLLRSKFRPAYS